MISLKNKTPNPWCWLNPANGFQKLLLKCDDSSGPVGMLDTPSAARPADCLSEVYHGGGHGALVCGQLASVTVASSSALHPALWLFNIAMV